jgi:hypothetical protein
VQACAVELHLDIEQLPLYTEIYRKNAADQNRAADFVRACAVETHINMSEEPLFTEIYREKAARQNFARPSSVLASGKGENPFWRFHKSHTWDHPIRHQLLEEEVGMTPHESKKVVLERDNFPPKSCSSSSQSTRQSATYWMIIMHPTCCRNSPGLTLTLDLVLFIYREILMSEANFMDGIPWPFSVTRRSATRPVLFFPPRRTNGANDAIYEKNIS